MLSHAPDPRMAFHREVALALFEEHGYTHAEVFDRMFDPQISAHFHNGVSVADSAAFLAQTT